MKTTIHAAQTKQEKVLDKMATAAKHHNYVLVEYQKKSTGRTVHRLLAPYEYTAGKVFVADKRKPRQIKCYLLDRILTVEITSRKFRPRWEIKI